MVHSTVQVFVLNFVTALDNAIMLAGIFKEHQARYWSLAACSAFILTVIRALLVLAVGPLAALSGVQLGLGIALFGLAVRTAMVDRPQDRKTGFKSKILDPSLLKLLGLVILTDFAVSFDNLVSIVAVTTNVVAVAIGVFLSLVPLLILLPIITKVFTVAPWVQIIAAGVMAQTATKVMMKDPFTRNHLPVNFIIFKFISLIVASLFIAIWLGVYILRDRSPGN